MTLKTEMAADLAVFYNTDEFAEDIKYTPRGFAERTIPAILDPAEETIDLQVVEGQRVVRIQANDANGVLVPAAGDTAVVQFRNAIVTSFTATPDGLEWVVVLDLGGPVEA